MKPKGVLPGTKKGSPMGTAKEPFCNPFFQELSPQVHLSWFHYASPYVSTPGGSSLVSQGPVEVP